MEWILGAMGGGCVVLLVFFMGVERRAREITGGRICAGCGSRRVRYEVVRYSVAQDDYIAVGECQECGDRWRRREIR